jgi:hypothetical protein
MAELSITAASVLTSDISKSRRGVAGTTITQGQALYEDTADSNKSRRRR